MRGGINTVIYKPIKRARAAATRASRGRRSRWSTDQYVCGATWTEVEEPTGNRKPKGTTTPCKRPVLAPEVRLFVRCLAPVVLFSPFVAVN